MRRNTAWAFAGNTVYAGCQWVVFVMLVRALAVEQAGAFAYATAITGPIFVLANVRLRILLTTGIESPGGFSDYLNARLLTTAAAIAVSLGVGAVVLPHSAWLNALAIMTMGRACDAVSDLCHGLFQREMDMRSPAIGLAINGLFSVVLVGAALVLTSSLLLATTAYAVGSLIALSAWDLPRAIRLQGGSTVTLPATARRPSAMKSAWRLITTGLPLGLSSAIGNVQANVPRYVIASFLGPAMLARFAAISYITLAGHLVVNATSQAALPMLAKDAQSPGSRYQTHLGTLVAGTFVLGALVLSAAYLFGRPILTFVYGSEYTDYAGVLFWLAAATVVTFASVFLGTGTAARHRFGSPFLISAMSLIVVAATTPPLVSRYGLYGAAWALVAGAIAEFAAYAVLTVRDLKATSEDIPGGVADAFAGGIRP
jgi:O-antigen/teichoic acid export membrane protein